MAFLKTIARRRHARVTPPRWLAWLLWLGLLISFPPATPAQTPISDENQIKAVFLFRIAQFVEWPTRVFPAKNAPLVIGILGQDPFGAYLDEFVKGETVAAHPVIIRRFDQVEEAKGCQILFISRSEAAALPRILAALKGESLLTVSDLDAFSRAGGMVRFVTDSGKIRFRIDVEAAKAAGLTISSKILRPDTIVTPGKD